MDLRLTQRAVAWQIGVNPSTVLLWEQGRTDPAVRLIPAVLAFLGYDPLPGGGDFREQLRLTRVRLGLSRRRFAQLLHIDEGTVGRWERGRTHPGRALVDRLEAVCVESAPHLASLIGSK